LDWTAQMNCDVDHKIDDRGPGGDEPGRKRRSKPVFSALTACALAAYGCGEDTTGPIDEPDPGSQLGNIVVESSIDVVMAVGRTMQLTVSVTDADGNPVTVGGIDWQSSNLDIATVSGSGMVTAVAAGEVRITAAYDGLSGTIPLTVIDADLEAIEQLRQDPLIGALVNMLDTDLATQLQSALNDLGEAVTVGNCMAVRDALEAALARTSASNDPDAVISLAVLGLALERAHDLLGL